eukprot:PhF_6_TR5074/c0_g1_i2/m.7107
MDRSRTPTFENAEAKCDPQLAAQYMLWTEKSTRLDKDSEAIVQQRQHLEDIKHSIQQAHTEAGRKAQEVVAKRQQLVDARERQHAQQNLLEDKKKELQMLKQTLQQEAAEVEVYVARAEEADRKAMQGFTIECDSLNRQLEALSLVLGEKQREGIRLRQEISTIESEKEKGKEIIARIGNIKDEVYREQHRQLTLRDKIARCVSDIEGLLTTENEMKEKLMVVQKQITAQETEATTHTTYLKDLAELLETAQKATDQNKHIHHMANSLKRVLTVLTTTVGSSSEQYNAAVAPHIPSHIPSSFVSNKGLHVGISDTPTTTTTSKVVDNNINITMGNDDGEDLVLELPPGTTPEDVRRDIQTRRDHSVRSTSSSLPMPPEDTAQHSRNVSVASSHNIVTFNTNVTAATQNASDTLRPKRGRSVLGELLINYQTN